MDSDFIHHEFFIRQQRYNDKDRLFFENVSSAMRKRPIIRRIGEEDKEYLIYSWLYANRYDLSGRNNKKLKEIHRLLWEHGDFDSGTEEGWESTHRI